MLNVPLPKQNLSGLSMASKLGSVMIDTGVYPSAGATETIESGYSGDIMLAVGPPVIYINYIKLSVCLHSI